MNRHRFQQASLAVNLARTQQQAVKIVLLDIIYLSVLLEIIASVYLVSPAILALDRVLPQRCALLAFTRLDMEVMHATSVLMVTSLGLEVQLATRV